MAYLEINPRYRVWFRRQGWFTPEAFLDWPGEVCSGHPDRHVRRVELPRESAPVSAYLKREHRVPWRDRIQHCRHLHWRSTHSRHRDGCKHDRDHDRKDYCNARVQATSCQPSC